MKKKSRTKKVVIFEGFDTEEEALKWYNEQKKKWRLLEEDFNKIFESLNKHFAAIEKCFEESFKYLLPESFKYSLPEKKAKK